MSWTLRGGDGHTSCASPPSLAPSRLISDKQWSHTFQGACVFLFFAICHDVTSSQSTHSAAWGSMCVSVWVFVCEGEGGGWGESGGFTTGKSTVIIWFCSATSRAHMHIKITKSTGAFGSMLPLSDVMHCALHKSAVCCAVVMGLWW